MRQVIAAWRNYTEETLEELRHTCLKADRSAVERLPQRSSFDLMSIPSELSNSPPLGAATGSPCAAAAAVLPVVSSCVRSVQVRLPVDISSPPGHPCKQDSLNDEDSLDSIPEKFSENLDDRSSVSSQHRDQLSNSSRESSPKSEIACFCNEGGGLLPEAPEVILCFWCKKVCDPRNLNDVPKENFLPNGERTFCSEICFNQCRRASFKKSKVCDWCRHVKPTLNYVDFSEGNHQLQFCSDKCLNQYKMHIFCRETEAHLQLHPHLNEIKSNKDDSLITPELWLKDCSEPKSSNILFNNETDAIRDLEEKDEHPILNLALTGNSATTSKSINTFCQLSTSSSSCSPKSFDASEPMNLTTQHIQRDGPDNSHSRSSPNERFKAINLTQRSANASAENKKGSYLRSSRSKVRTHRGDGGYNTGKSRDTKSIPTQDIPQDEKEPKIVGTIRVRQLEENVESSPASPANLHLNELSNLSLLIGRHFPLMPGIPTLLAQNSQTHHPSPNIPGVLPSLPPPQPPPPQHPELPHPPILPQLLLSQQDILRYNSLCPPLILPPASPMHISPQPPSIARTPPPPNPPATSNNNVSPNENNNNPKFQLTSFLPLPLPIPIPIPIPFPIPILKKDFAKLGFFSKSDKTSNDVSSKVDKNTPTEKEFKDRESNSSQEDNQAKAMEGSSHSSQPHSAKSTNKHNASHTSDESKETTLSPLDGRAAERKERSILKYTSDVYEVNGTYMPKTSGWQGNVNNLAEDCQAVISKVPLQTAKPSQSSNKSPQNKNVGKRKRLHLEKSLNQFKNKKRIIQ